MRQHLIEPPVARSHRLGRFLRVLRAPPSRVPDRKGWLRSPAYADERQLWRLWSDCHDEPTARSLAPCSRCPGLTATRLRFRARFDSGSCADWVATRLMPD